MSENHSRVFAPALYDRILRAMRRRHPLPCLSGYLSLETLYSLKDVDAALIDLRESGHVRYPTEEERRRYGYSSVADIYSLTILGYETKSME